MPDKVALAPDANVRDMVSYNAAAEQNVIRMEADTVLAIDKLLISNTGVDAVSDTELDLRQGTIFGNVKKLSAASQYLIKTPNGIAGVRGTTFIIERKRRRHGDRWLHGAFPCRANGQITTVGAWIAGDQFDPGHRPGHPCSRRRQLTSVRKQTAVSYRSPSMRASFRSRMDQTIVYISPTHGVAALTVDHGHVAPVAIRYRTANDDLGRLKFSKPEQP